MSTAAVVARIATQYSDKGSKAAQKDIARLTKKFEAFGKKAKKSFGLAITATAALAVKIGKDAVQAAIEDNKSQLILADAMRVSTGATEEAIKAAEDYIKATMFRTHVADEELRSSLAQLYIATKSQTEAERLQGLAIDIAAAKSLDLAKVTDGITKAQQGTVGVLKRLNPEIAGLIGKTTKAEEIFAVLGLTYGGTAEKLADLDPLKKLQLSYGEVLETLGNALLPTIQLFAEYIVKNVVPAVDKWIAANGDKLAQALEGALDLFILFIDLAADLAAFYNNFKGLIKFGITMLAVGRAMKGVAFITKDLGKVFSLFKNKAAGLTGAVEAFIGRLIFTKGPFKQIMNVLYKGTQLVKNFAMAFFGVGTFILVARNAVESFLKIKFPRFWWENKAKEAADDLDILTKKTFNQIRAEAIAAAAKVKSDKAAKIIADKLAKQAEIDAANEAFDAAKSAKEKAEERAEYVKMIAVKKQLVAIGINPRSKEESKNLKAALELLKKKGKAASTYEKERIAAQIKIKANGIKARDNKDPIDLEAARLLLLKQKDNEESLKQLANLTKNIFLQGLRNTLSERYQDILLALSDSKIDSKDIATLAGKWGVTIEAAKAYIETIFAISDGTISDDEITDLAKSWGSTKEQAAQYLDFFTYLNDGILSDAEIEKLKSKWGMTEAQVRQYADFVGVVNDGKLTDTEIKNLMAKWKMTTDEVVAYILKIGSPVSYSGTLITPAQIAELAWKSATAALAAYLALLAKGSSGSTTIVPVVPVVPVVPPGGVPGGNTSNGNLIKALEEAVSLTEYAKAKAAGDMNAAAIAAAGVNPSALAAQENGIIGAASIAAKLKAAEDALAASQAVANQANTLAAFKAKEARDLAASQAAAAQMDYDERFKFRAAQGVMSATAGSSSSSGVVVNLTVNGSVSTENDLVASIRQGLLRGQYNGQTLTLESI